MVVPGGWGPQMIIGASECRCFAADRSCTCRSGNGSPAQSEFDDGMLLGSARLHSRIQVAASTPACQSASPGKTCLHVKSREGLGLRCSDLLEPAR